MVKPCENSFFLYQINGILYFIVIIGVTTKLIFRRETASGFYPWGNVDVPRKRVAVGVCGSRHGNSFPMAQSAQSHSQMRSIPHCPKAVFYVFVFHSIHNSAIKYNYCPLYFSTEPQKPHHSDQQKNTTRRTVPLMVRQPA